jgi:hypothetical protein
MLAMVVINSLRRCTDGIHAFPFCHSRASGNPEQSKSRDWNNLGCLLEFTLHLLLGRHDSKHTP